jgi:hypothetical protein
MKKMGQAVIMGVSLDGKKLSDVEIKKSSNNYDPFAFDNSELKV